MKTKLNGILTLLLALVVQVAFAQQTVTGKVTDPSGEAIFGATIQVEGTQTFTTTDFDGNFSIAASPENVIVISYTGYDTMKIPVGDQTTINVELKTSLDEVVVMAYRTSSTKRSNVAASVVTAKQIQDRPNASAIQRLQGQVPGLVVQTASGQPGANSTIQLRGVSSINGNTEPLIIIDGIPVDEDAFRTINPLDIESTTVLKDAAGTAIYGNRGANGVIIITTKGGKFDSPLSVQYTAQTRFTDLIDNNYNLYSAQDYLRLENRQNVGLGASLSEAEIAAFGVNTDWRDTFYRTGISQLHNFSLRSGGKNLSQFTSINYTMEEGSLLASSLQRITFRNNLNIKSDDDRFNLATSLQVGYSGNNSQQEPENRNNAIYFNSIFNANNGLPYFDPNNRAARTEEWVSGLQARFSPYVTLDNVLFNGNREDELKIVAGANSSYKISDNWTASYRIGMDYTQETFLRWADPNSALARVRASFISADAVEGFQNESFFRDFRFNSTASIGYNKTFGADENGENGHTIIANGYLEYVKAHFKSFGFSQTGLDPRTFSPGNDGGAFIGDNEANDEFVPTVNSAKASTGLFSYFGEFDYDYDNRYGLTATLRRDASSRFVGDNKWGTFWSVAGRWNLTEEAFMNDVSWVNDLKLRASYGTVGNDRIASTYYGALNNTRTLFGTGLSYNDNQTFLRTQLGNEELRWETVRTANFGIEFALLEQRLRGTLELYERKTEDLFSSRRVSTLVTGSGAIQANIGDLVNRGVELGIRYDLIRGDQKTNGFDLDLFANVSFNENEVTSIDAPDGLIDNGATVIQEGVQLNEYFVVPYLGVNPANGNLLFQDINGNATEAPGLEDRRLTGTDTVPDFQGGFGFEASYKNFFIETQFSFMTGLQRFDFNLQDYYDINSLGDFQLSSDLERSWTPDNRVTDMPSLAATNTAPGVESDRFLIDSDFLRLRFLQVGYNFDQSILDKTFLKSARVYANAENLITWTKWMGSDPESTRLSEYNRYPTPRVLSVGIDLQF
jgi:TonB-linked SusC/RagA family outer membrane protein